jgi:hypothetical protein
MEVILNKKKIVEIKIYDFLPGPVDNLCITYVMLITKILFRHAREYPQFVSGLC